MDVFRPQGQSSTYGRTFLVVRTTRVTVLSIGDPSWAKMLEVELGRRYQDQH